MMDSEECCREREINKSGKRMAYMGIETKPAWLKHSEQAGE